MVRFLGAPLADPALMGADLWSDSVLTALYDAIHAVALTTTGATSLMHEAKVDVVTVPNLSEHLSNAATTAQLSARFGYAAAMKSMNNLLLLGDGETWARQRVDFAGLPEMVRTVLQVAAGAADIPVTRLLGQSPAGLSATGDSDIRNYYDMIAARQEIDLRPQLERLDRLLMASAGLAPGALSFSFRPLWQMDAATKAATALGKAQATAIYAGLGLWPNPVMAGLVAGQLAEDGIYPDAGAAFAAAEREGLQQPVRDYSPDQPRDPQGRWSEGGGRATPGHPDDPAPEAAPADPPRSLTIHPKAGRSSNETESPPRSSMATGLLGLIGNALSALSPISPAHAEESNPTRGRDNPVRFAANGPPDLTPTEPLAGLGRGLGGIIAGLAVRTVRFGAAKFLRWLREHNGGSDPDPNESASSPASGVSQPTPRPPNSRISLPENEAQLKHIFRDEAGHLANTEANRALLSDVANDSKSILGADKYGNVWSGRSMPNGSQVWVQSRSERVINGGLNSVPKDFNPATGLSSPTIPKK